MRRGQQMKEEREGRVNEGMGECTGVRYSLLSPLLLG